MNSVCHNCSSSHSQMAKTQPILSHLYFRYPQLKVKQVCSYECALSLLHPFSPHVEALIHLDYHTHHGYDASPLQFSTYENMTIDSINLDHKKSACHEKSAPERNDGVTDVDSVSDLFEGNTEFEMLLRQKDKELSSKKGKAKKSTL